MIKTNHTFWGHLTMGNYIKRIIKKDFKEIVLHQEENFDENKSTILLPNHISWWDGFWLYDLNRKIWKKKFHLMMLESELSKHKIFSNIGAYSINPGSRSVIETLNYTQQLSRVKENLIVIYPQGKIFSQQIDNIQYQSGIKRLLQKIEDSDIYFVSVFVNYGSNRKPTVDVFLKRSLNIESIENEYNDFYSHAKDLIEIR